MRKRLMVWGTAAGMALAGLLSLPGPAAAAELGPEWAAQLRSTGYLRQVEIDGEEQDRLGFFQNFDLNSSGWWDRRLSVRFAGRLAEDLRADEDLYDTGKFYTGYVRLHLPESRLDLRLGRQFLTEGTYFMTFDGARLSWRLGPRYEWRVWGGARAPENREFEFGNVLDEVAVGSRLLARLTRNVDGSLWWAYTEREERTEAQPVGAGLRWRLPHGISAYLRGAYETETEELERIELLARWAERANWPSVTVQYLVRRPQIDAGSWFERFEDVLEDIRIFRTTLRYQKENGYGAEVEGFGSFVDDVNTGRVGVAALAPHLRVGYSRTFGDRGDEDQFYGNVHVSPTPWLRLRAGAVLTEYALLADASGDDDRDLVTSYLRAELHAYRGVRLLTELQALDTPFYSEDVRLLLGLDLRAASGEVHGGFPVGR